MSAMSEQPALLEPARPLDQPLALRKTQRTTAGSNMYRVVQASPQTSSASKKAAVTEMAEPNERPEIPAASPAGEETPKKTPETPAANKRKRSSSSGPSRKRPRGNGEGGQADDYCWSCHKECNKESTTLKCEVCPRIHHFKCVPAATAAAGGAASEQHRRWVCPECEQIMRAENMATRSAAMRTLSIDQLCNLLKFALARMKHQCAEEFLRPVSLEAFPKYSEYVCHPMDLETLEKNIKKRLYGCTESFLADMKWIVHNCIIFNGYHNRLTSLSKSLLKICKHEMSEIEVCPDCYHNAYSKRENWFIEPCCPPHLLIWAKLKGFPYWPAKAMRVVSGNVDVRFFGAHDRSWIPLANCYLLSKEAPTGVKIKKKGMFEQSMQELDSHVDKLVAMFNNFGYAELRKTLNANDLKSDVQDMLPGVNLKDYRRSSIGRIGLHGKSPKGASATPVISPTVTTTPSTPALQSSKTTEEQAQQGARMQLVQVKVERFDYPSSSPHPSDDSGHASESGSSRVTPAATPPEAAASHRRHPPGPKCSKRAHVSSLESGSKLEATIAKLQAKSNGRETTTACTADAESSPSVPSPHDETSLPSLGEQIVADVSDGNRTSQVASSEPCEVSSTTCVIDEPSADAAVVKDSPPSTAVVVPSADQRLTDTDCETPAQEESINASVAACPDEKVVTAYSDITDAETSTDSSSNHALTIDMEPAAVAQQPVVVDQVSLSAEVAAKPEVEIKPSVVVLEAVEPAPVANETNVECERVSSPVTESTPALEIRGANNTHVVNVAVVTPTVSTPPRQAIEESLPIEDNLALEEEEEESERNARLAPSAATDLDMTVDVCQDVRVSSDSDAENDDDDAPAPGDPGLGRVRGMTASLMSTLIDELSKSAQASIDGTGGADAGATTKKGGERGSQSSADEEGRGGPVTARRETDGSGSQGEEGDLVIDLDRDGESEGGRALAVAPKRAKSVKKVVVPAHSPFGGIRLKEKKVVRAADRDVPPIVVSKSKAKASLDTQMSRASAQPTAIASKPEVVPLPMLSPMGLQQSVPRFHIRVQPAMPRTMPALQLRPLIVNPAAGSASSSTAAAAAAASPPQHDSLSKYSKKMAEFVRGTMEEMFQDLAKSGNPEATIKTLQLEMEKMQWRHQQELAEMKHNTDLILLETRNSMEADKQRAVNEIRRKCELEKQKAVEETKRKLWCATCGKEAIFYCCWNTAYCDYPCQQAHWPHHVNSCTQGHGAKKARTNDSAMTMDYDDHSRRKSAPLVYKKTTTTTNTPQGRSPSTIVLPNTSMMYVGSQSSHQQQTPHAVQSSGRPHMSMSGPTIRFANVTAPPGYTLAHIQQQQQPHVMQGQSSSHAHHQQQQRPVQSCNAMYPVTSQHQHIAASHQSAPPNVQLYVSHNARPPTHSLTVARSHHLSSSHQYRGRTYM